MTKFTEAQKLELTRKIHQDFQTANALVATQKEQLAVADTLIATLKAEVTRLKAILVQDKFPGFDK